MNEYMKLIYKVTNGTFSCNGGRNVTSIVLYE